jgi:hypothetical protein
LVVKPGDPFQGGELDGFLRLSWCPTMNQLGFVESIDSLCQGVVITVAFAAYRWFDGVVKLSRPLRKGGRKSIRQKA